MVVLLWITIGVLVYTQYTREVSYRRQFVTEQLNTITNRIINYYERNADMTPFLKFIEQYYDNSMFDEVMISIYDRDNNLVYSLGAPIPLEMSQGDLADKLANTN